MLLNYTELYEKIKGIKEKLDESARTLEGITPKESEKYENPKYRMWSGDIKDLDGFADRLEEWLRQPFVAEAKRYLSDLRKWAELTKEIALEEIEKDWRFLSDNIEEIKDIHKQVGDIGYESIKKKTSTWILERIIEKDMERAKNWAANASKFSNSLRQLEDKKVESKLAEEVKRDAIEELLKVTSFDTDNKEAINRYQELIVRAENIVKNKPVEIEEKAILKTYSQNKKIEESLSTISKEIGKIRTFLIELEWVKEFPNFKDFNKLWTKKKTAIEENDLENIAKELEDTIKEANLWKDSRKREIDSAFVRIERMSRSAEKDTLKEEVASLKEESRGINWNKPNLESLSEVLSKMDKLIKKLREELIKKLKNEDAISIIEEPEIIENLGKKKGWDFNRFIQALVIILENGLIEIRAVEEK